MNFTISLYTQYLAKLEGQKRFILLKLTLWRIYHHLWKKIFSLKDSFPAPRKSWIRNLNDSSNEEVHKNKALKVNCTIFAKNY